MAKEIYVADFETSHDNIDGKEYAWVWCAGYQRLYTQKIDDLKIQGNIKDFVQSLMKGKTKKVYFHNLKFDGQFLMAYFLHLGYKYKDNPDKPKTFSYVIDLMGTFYAIKIPFINEKKKLQHVTFLDSAKIYPYPLKTLAKQMGMPVSKGDLDYNLVRKPNHNLTHKELDYFRRDILILKIAMEQAYTKGYNKMTIGANALEQFKETLKLENRAGKWVFKDLFPDIPDDVDSFLRNAYKGGCCMVKKGCENKVLPIHSYDINSMYPAQLRNKPMPFGVPKRFEGKWIPKDNKVCVQKFSCSFVLKEGYLPTIQIKGHPQLFRANEWVENSPYKIELYLTNIDLEIFFKHYDVYDIDWLGGYEFYTSTGLFKKYIDNWLEVKKTTKDDGERLFSKLFLNNIYGKFATNPKRISSRYELVEGVMHKSENVETYVKPIYLPVGIFTTSYARAYLIEQAQKNYDTFVYCDTDSLHLTKPTDNIPLHNSELGYFKYEYYGTAKHIKQKTYIAFVEKENKFNEWHDVNKWQVTCAGLNKELLQGVEIDFDKFKIGASFPKLVMRRVIGGVYLSNELHTIT